MKYLYSGDCSNLNIPETDVLEVLAAASFFQLLPLQRHCEARAAKTVDLHNLVSVYIHAKVEWNLFIFSEPAGSFPTKCFPHPTYLPVIEWLVRRQ